MPEDLAKVRRGDEKCPGESNEIWHERATNERECHLPPGDGHWARLGEEGASKHKSADGREDM